MNLPASVTLVEVGPRDGLQNEAQRIALATKLRLLDDLAAAGLQVIETGSFVNPKWIPQMADSDAVFAGLQRRPGVRYTALTPNLHGFERALAAGADEVAIFAAASESFSRKNINCGIDDSLRRFADVMVAARRHQLPVRGYISCVLGCPYEGPIAPAAVAAVAGRLLDMGCRWATPSAPAPPAAWRACWRSCWRSTPRLNWRCTAMTPTVRRWRTSWWRCSTASLRSMHR